MKKEEEKGRSCLSKCGSLIKTLIMYGIVAAVLIPMLYETYHKFMKTGNSLRDQEYETVNMQSKEDMTTEDITRQV